MGREPLGGAVGPSIPLQDAPPAGMHVAVVCRESQVDCPVRRGTTGAAAGRDARENLTCEIEHAAVDDDVDARLAVRVPLDLVLGEYAIRPPRAEAFWPGPADLPRAELLEDQVRVVALAEGFGDRVAAVRGAEYELQAVHVWRQLEVW